jgi:hypothetical protein
MIEVTEQDRIKYPYHTDKSILGIKFIQSLSNDELESAVDAIRNQERYSHPTHLKVMEFLGPSTNPEWVVGEILETAYVRDIIDGSEMDYLSR